MATDAQVGHSTEIRLVLLGALNEGKKSAGDTILGRDTFGHHKNDCVIKNGWVAGKKVTIIDTPGWGREQSISETPENFKQKLLQSVFPPGVHALLLIIRTDRRFTEANRLAVQEHMELLGERVWDYTVVLFTQSHWFNDNPIEDFICSEGKALEWVLRRAGLKYYCINISERADMSQVERLLGLIEHMIASQGCFNLDKEIYEREIQKAKAQEEAKRAMLQGSWGMTSSWAAKPANLLNSEAQRCDSRLNPPLMSQFPDEKLKLEHK